ncbi:hypothetical protein EJV47_11380 [Hymenobacter gummosus]|uniref:Outer membrane protein assembly factor BamE n=1 Tax=Hymenobacter gummosus TaxID=1776032 RepID=A0A3S0H5S4_9BACT|nr:hypothetical protein [Hymenobacter gummosus]RTQ50225.1 hypothetical protein EJV47_11380 [Hymenobacter gummosus]
MRVRTIRFLVLAPLLMVALLGLYLGLFSRSSRVYGRMKQVEIGMTRQQATQLLSPPDTAYWWVEEADSVLVLHYDMGFGAPDALCVLVRRDTVTAVVYNQ